MVFAVQRGILQAIVQAGEVMSVSLHALFIKVSPI